MVEKPPFDRSGFYGFPFGTMSGYIFAAQAAEVEVDIETGKVRVIQGASAHDMGQVIHPQNAEGQIEEVLFRVWGIPLRKRLPLMEER